MPEQFTVHCPCGKAVVVQVHQAGSHVGCPACEADVIVPMLSELRRLAGQSNPYLSGWGRVVEAVSEGCPPFDGHCQNCSRPGVWQQDLTLQVLTERELTGSNGLTLNLNGLGVAVDSGRTHWNSITVPLIFCEDCRTEFRSSFIRRTLYRTTLLLIGIPAAIAILVIARFSGWFMLVLIPLLMLAGRRKEIDQRWKEWLDQIPAISDALRAESEVRFRVGSLRRI